MLAHRWVAEQTLGRSLLPREVVHHKDGDSLNNDPDNLIVLPSQRVHAHAEFHLRRLQTGMPSLFPELFQVIPADTQGTLFANVLVWQGQEPPLAERNLELEAESLANDAQPSLFENLEEREVVLLVREERDFGSSVLADLLRDIRIQISIGNGAVQLPLQEFR